MSRSVQEHNDLRLHLPSISQSPTLVVNSTPASAAPRMRVLGTEETGNDVVQCWNESIWSHQVERRQEFSIWSYFCLR